MNIETLKSNLATAYSSLPREECQTCECWLGFLAKVEIDLGKERSSWISEYRSNNDRINSCLGCDPCPPADLFAEYLREKDDEGY